MAALGTIMLAHAATGQQSVADAPVVRSDSGTVMVQGAQRIALAYAYEHVPYKPYVRRLCSPSGLNVLRARRFEVLPLDGGKRGEGASGQ